MALDIGIDPAEPGDRYWVQFGPESTIKNVGNTLFKASKPMLEGKCSGAATTTTTSSPTSTTTTTTVYSSPSRAFLIQPVDLLG
jgi:hypothetical protein